MAGPNGGSRPGAGRKPKAEKFAGPIAAAEQKIADRLPKILESLIDQAMGWVVAEPEEEWVPAGLVTVKGPIRVRRPARGPDDPEEPEGWTATELVVWLDDKGKPAIVDLPVFPHLNPDVLVRVRRKTVRVLPDFRAAAYLVDRLMGKAPVEAQPVEELLDLRAAVIAAHAAVAARKAARDAAGGPAAPPPPGADDDAGTDL